MFGRKSEGYQSRIAEAKVLTHLMTTKRPFCFLRMGDNELMYLLTYQAGKTSLLETDQMTKNQVFSGTEMEGNPGIGTKHAARLWHAYEKADYVDFHESNWPNEHLVKMLKLKKTDGTQKNPSKETSLSYLTWMEIEFKSYCSKRKVCFFGAEAEILKNLAETNEFKTAAQPIWPGDAEVFYLQPFENGQNISQNLAGLKNQAYSFCSSQKIDTLFISLGGAAKIIAFELSRELGICCFDFGAMTRALTYSGCDGNRYARSPHYPFFYRLPFDVHMDALELAMPCLSPAELLAKAHGQVILELVRKEYGWSHAAKEIEISRENLKYFRKALKQYENRYFNIWKTNTLAKRERSKFLHFCGKHRLTLQGRAFLWFFNCRALFNKVLNKKFFLK